MTGTVVVGAATVEEMAQRDAIVVATVTVETDKDFTGSRIHRNTTAAMNNAVQMTVPSTSAGMARQPRQ